MAVLQVIIAIIFAALSVLHFKWVLFGIKRPELVIPSLNKGKAVNHPGALPTAIVGLGLLLFSFLFFAQWLLPLDFKWIDNLQLGVGILFLIRAIGEFNYVGFFKMVKNTPFAKLDTQYYSPLCLLLAILIALTQVV